MPYTAGLFDADPSKLPLPGELMEMIEFAGPTQEEIDFEEQIAKIEDFFGEFLGAEPSSLAP